MSLRAPLLPMAMMLAASGCFLGAPVLMMEVTHEPPRAMTPRHAELFVAGPPQRPYLEVGVISLTGGFWTNARQLLHAFVVQAGKEGCDGVVVTADGAYTRGGCLVWAEPVAGAPAPPPAPR